MEVCNAFYLQRGVVKTALSVVEKDVVLALAWSLLSCVALAELSNLSETHVLSPT